MTSTCSLADPPLTPLAGRKAGKALVRPVRRRHGGCSAPWRLCLPPKTVARNLCPEGHAAEDLGTAVDRDTAIHEARKAASGPGTPRRPRFLRSAARPRARPRRRRTCRNSSATTTTAWSQRTVLRGWPTRPVGGEDTFTYGVMYERQACAASEIEREFAARRPG